MSVTAWLSGRRPIVLRTARFLPLACSAMLLAACGAQPERSAAPGPKSAGGSAAPLSTSPDATGQFRVVIGDTTLTGHLFDNATAKDFASQLPMTLTFSDLHGVEKGAPLPRKLSVDGMPAGEDPQVGDLGYWAPDGNLVLYYGDVSYWTGIMRIGHFEGDMGAVANQSNDFSATVELAP